MHVLAIVAAVVLGADPAPLPPPAAGADAPMAPPAPAADAAARARFDAARASLLRGELDAAARELDVVAADGAASAGLAEAARILAETSRELSRRGRFVLAEPFSRERPDRRGRGELVWFSTFYGMFAANGLAAGGGVEDGNAYLLLTIGGATAGLVGSLAATRDGAMSRGRASTITSATFWSSMNAAALAAIADAEAEPALVATVATGGAALAASALLTRERAPSEGDVAVVNSAGWWGGVAAALALTFLDDVEGPDVAWALLGGADAGLLAGGLIARRHDVSRSRAFVVNAGGLLGALVGVAFPVLGEADDAAAYGAAALGGIAAGLVAATRLPREGPAARDARARASAPSRPHVAPTLVALGDGTLGAGLSGSF